MKEQIALYRNIEWSWYLIKTKPSERIPELESLASFLTEDCTRENTPKFIEWLKKPNKADDKSNHHISGNEFYLLDLNNSIIITRTLIFSRDELIGPIDEDSVLAWEIDAPKFYTTKEQLIPLLEEWNKILNMNPRPNEVTLTKEGKKLSLAY